jgi:hypothetical protein
MSWGVRIDWYVMVCQVEVIRGQGSVSCRVACASGCCQHTSPCPIGGHRNVRWHVRGLHASSYLSTVIVSGHPFIALDPLNSWILFWSGGKRDARQYGCTLVATFEVSNDDTSTLQQLIHVFNGIRQCLILKCQLIQLGLETTGIGTWRL